jgi:hypothetical protein
MSDLIAAAYPDRESERRVQEALDAAASARA